MHDTRFLQTMTATGAVFAPLGSTAAPASHNGLISDNPPGVATHFGDPLAEHAALTTGVGLADFSGRTQIEMTGADRAAFLHNLCTNQIRDLRPGAGCEAFLTNDLGIKRVNELSVLVLDELELDN